MCLRLLALLAFALLLAACGGAAPAAPTAASQTATPVPTQPRPVPSPTLPPSPPPLPDPTVTPPPSPTPVPSPTPLPVEWRPPATRVLLTGQSVLYRVGDAVWRSDVHLLFAEQLTADDFLALHPLREGDPEAGLPYLSPDGRWLAQLCAPDAVCLADLGTGATRTLPIAASELAWSPGSDGLAYVALTGRSPYEVRLYDLRSDTDRLLVETAGGAEGRPVNLLWNPDGTRLAYLCCYARVGGEAPVSGPIQAVTVADGAVDVLGEVSFGIAGGGQDFCWTMTGEITMDEADGVVCTGVPRAARVSDTSEQGLYAFWEVDAGDAGGWDAMRIVVSEEGENGVRLWEMEVDSDQPLRLSWAPDGRYLFFSQGGPQAGLWRVNADGSDPRLLVDDALLLDVVDAWAPLLPRLDVSPDGRWLAETIVGEPEEATAEEIADLGVYEKRRVQFIVRRSDGGVVWNVVDEYRGVRPGRRRPAALRLVGRRHGAVFQQRAHARRLHHLRQRRRSLAAGPAQRRRDPAPALDQPGDGPFAGRNAARLRGVGHRHP